MTYEDRFARALKLKDFISLYDNKGRVYLIFTDDTEFKVRMFGEELDDNAKNQISHDSIHVTK